MIKLLESFLPRDRIVVLYDAEFLLCLGLMREKKAAKFQNSYVSIAVKYLLSVKEVFDLCQTQLERFPDSRPGSL